MRLPLLLAFLLAPLAHADTLFCRASLTTGANNGTSWADAFRGPLALQAALAGAHPGDQIWLAAGTYKPALPGGPRSATFTLASGVSLLGGFAGSESSADQRTPGHETVLSGDLNNNGNNWPGDADNANRVLTGVDLDASTLLDSLTITSAVSDSANDPFNHFGAGLLILRGAPTVRRCTFRANTSSWLGGGAAALDAAPLFEDCTFDGNSARSGHNLASLQNSDAVVRRCRFIGDCHVTGGCSGIGILSGPILPNAADRPSLLVEDSLFSIAENEFACPAGMGVYASQGTADIRRCDFIDNKTCGGGGGLSGDADFTVDRCRFIGNEGSADGGAAIHTFGGRYTVTNSLFHANDREGFSTISALGGSFRAVNCTFSNNGSTSGLGGGFHAVILSSIPQALFQNCIFWANVSRSGNAVTQPAGGSYRFDRCLVQGWNGSLPGAGSFAADPRFRDPDGPDGVPGNADDDLRLLPASPAIDRADNTAIASTLDLDGLPRFRQAPDSPDLGLGDAPFADLGAFEFQPPCPPDFNADGFLDFFDYDAFVEAFESGAPSADFNHDAFLDLFDYTDFLTAFELGC